jgi:hypothetical protein
VGIAETIIRQSLKKFTDLKQDEVKAKEEESKKKSNPG